MLGTPSIARARRLVAWGALLLVFPTAATAQSSSPIVVTDAWARRAPAVHGGAHGSGPAGNGAVYATISNRGAEEDAVISATSDAARTAELHEVRSEGGVMAMRPVARMPLPAGGTLQLKPGGYHVMLLGLTRDLHPGDQVKVTLRFEKAPPLAIEAEVR